MICWVRCSFEAMAVPQWRLAAVVVAACAASAHATEIASVRIARHGAGTNLVFGDCSTAMKWALTPAAAAQTVARGDADGPHQDERTCGHAWWTCTTVRLRHTFAVVGAV